MSLCDSVCLLAFVGSLTIVLRLSEHRRPKKLQGSQVHEISGWFSVHNLARQEWDLNSGHMARYKIRKFPR